MVVVIESAHIPGLELRNSMLPGFSGRGARIDHDLLFNGSTVSGRTSLQGASIKGWLECASATLQNPDGQALSLNGAEIAGSVFLTKNFHATGEVRALGTVIKGSLACVAATLENPDGNVLSLDGAEIGGDVFLSARFQATGAVRAPGARFGGALVCSDARLSNGAGFALM